MKYLITVLLLMVSAAACCAEQAYEFDDPAKRALFLDLTQELRCPMCQNQNIADSDAMIAHDLRRKVYELIEQGYSRVEIVNYMKSRYGDFVSYQPPVTPATIWLWILPGLFVVIAVSLVLVRRKTTVETFDQETMKKAEAILEKEQ